MFIESAVRYAVSSLLIGRLGAGIHIPDFFVPIPLTLRFVLSYHHHVFEQVV